MKKKILFVLMSSGWLFLVIFILSGYYFNKFSDETGSSNFRPIEWGDHVQFFKGAIQCNLSSDKLLERKKVLKEKIFSKTTKKEEKTDGVVYYFEDDKELLNDVLEFIQKEKACCPFFKFDISILPFDYGFAIQVSGSEEVLEMLKDFENSDF